MGRPFAIRVTPAGLAGLAEAVISTSVTPIAPSAAPFRASPLVPGMRGWRADHPVMLASKSSTPLRRRLFSVVLPLAGCVAAGLLQVQAADATVDFAREIEPILIKRCSECHGPDKQKGELRLDSRALALKPAKSGKLALVPGKPEESEILKRVLASDPDDVMPPKEPRLTAAEVDSLRRWIAAGAVWPEVDPRAHWAFRVPVRPVPPEVASTT